MDPLAENLKKIEEIWGVKAWNDICKYIYTLVRKIEDLTKSREKWKARALKAEKANL